MTFAEKLDFLMNVTKTSNSALAGRVSLDASYISRLRRGKRLTPKNRDIIRDMSSYLARRCTEDYQKKALAEALKSAVFPEDATDLAAEIARWLLQDGPGNSGRVEMFLNGLSSMNRRPAQALRANPREASFPREAISVYYGIEGKRMAAEYFLSEVASQERPQTLLLFSDEETSWMTEDSEYAQRWAELMIRVLSKGNLIKIIHTISRDLDEMLNAIFQWMPLYMTGSIEPYFYPKKRDGIFKQTLFIAPETAAVVSSSIGDQIAVAANVLYRDHAAISSYAEEFRQYLRLCRPLMQIFTAAERESCYQTLFEFEKERSDTLIKTESLSMLTMPETLMIPIVKRCGIDESAASSAHGVRRKEFLKNLNTNRFTEIISLPDIETVRAGGVKVSMSDMLAGGAVYYTPEEFAAHVEHIISLLASSENYHVHLIDKRAEDSYTVYAREELGVIVAKTSQPPIVLAMSENNMAAAFWDFLKNMIGEKAYGAPDKAAAVVLERYLAGLR